MTKTYKVAEMFESINGEGSKSGQLAFFIRFAGCNLSCSYCDTMWANDTEMEFQELSVGKIYEAIKLSGLKNITLTGGEPLHQPDISELIDILLLDEKIEIEIETNGSIDLSIFLSKRRARRPIFTMDYKLPSSGMEIMMLVSNFDLLTKDDTVKFVVGDTADMERALTVIDAYELTSKCHVSLSPVYGMLEPKEIIDFMKENKMNGVNLQLQIHKLIWGAEERGV